MMDKDTYIEIAGKIADGTASEREIELYNAYFNAYQLKYPSWNELDALKRKEMIAEAEEGIHVQLRHHDDKKSERLWPRIAVAAAAVAAITLGVWLYNISNTPSRPEFISGSLLANDIAPGKNGATITLANGKVIDLSDSKTGVVIGQDLKYSDGSSVGRHPEFISGSRNSKGGGPDLRQDDVMQLTASTAKGQTYQFTLPDGTKVWLNADSKISFPSQFIGKERKILLEGEGYFEVVHNTKQPFTVESKGQVVEDIGTAFNINAYADEASVRTTLVEGSAAVTSLFHNEVAASRRTLRNGEQGGERSIVLKPNQQSTVTGSGRIKVENIDPESVVAWKNGEFMFNDEQLNSIMRKVSRWYNVEVVYKDSQIGGKIFGGTISCFGNVSDVLRMLELTGEVHFKVEGRRIVVTK